MKFIKMCVLLFSLTLISLSYAQDSIVYKTVADLDSLSSNNFLPLAKGNVYQFVDTYHYQTNQYTAALYTTKITDTATINGELFFLVSGYYNNSQFYLRYDPISKKAYRANSPTATPYVYFDFNLPNDSQYVAGNDTVKAMSDGNRKGFYTADRKETVYRNLGFYSGTNGFDASYMYHTYYFRNALIKDGNITYNIGNNYKPVFSYAPINIITSNVWHLMYKIFHGDNVPFVGDNEFHFNYVDKTYMESYYKKGNDSISKPEQEIPRVMDRVADTDVYLTLDSALLRQNYKFYYRFRTTDRYLMPHTVYSPEAGYYSLSSVMDVKDENIKDLNYSLNQNYPNPFNPTTTINYYIPSESKVNINVYNALGSKVKELVSENKSQGNYEVKFDGAGLASGVYFVTLKAASVDGKQSFVSSKKMILMK